MLLPFYKCYGETYTCMLLLLSQRVPMLCGLFTEMHGGGLGRGGCALIDAEMILCKQQ